MASIERSFSFRHEGHMFFIYDHKKKKEEDDPKDAILYFYPQSVKTDDQIALVGGIIGITDFCLEFLPQEMPHVIKLSVHNFALIQHGDYIIGLAGSTDVPVNFLLAHMQFLWSIFVFYQGSIVALRQQHPNTFLRELNMIWDIYLPLCQSQGDLLGQSFQAIPYIQLHKSQSGLFLHASHILQRSLRHKGVLAGALFSKHKILCTQLSNTLTRKLLLLMMQSQFPSVEVNSYLELPGGVHLICVYLTTEDYKSLNHRRGKKYSPSSSQSSAEDSVSEKTSQLPDTKNGSVKNCLFSDSAISSGGEQMASHMTSISSNSPNSSGGSGRSSLGNSSFGDKCELKRVAVSPKSLVLSGTGTDSEVYVDTVSEFQNESSEFRDVPKNGEIDDVCEKSGELDVSENVNKLSGDLTGEFDISTNLEKRQKEPFQKLTKEVSCGESQQSFENCNGDVLEESFKDKSGGSEYNSSLESPRQEQSSSSFSLSDKSSHSPIGVSGVNDDKEEKVCDGENSIPESQQGSFQECVKKADDHILSNVAEKDLDENETSRWSVKNCILNNDSADSTQKHSLSLSLNGKTQKGENDISVFKGSAENLPRKSVSLENTFIRRVLNSEDESSFQSSCEVKRDDGEERSRESSVVSLANSDVTSSKDRLTFENLDSENSDCDVASPDPETGGLSPTGERCFIPIDLKSLKTAEGGEVVSSLKSFHNGLEEEGDVVEQLSEWKNSGEDNSKWTPQQDGLVEMKVYIQGHSDTLLVLLMEKDVNCDKTFVHSLWKSCLSHLAELDFEVKNVERHMKDESENLGALYQFMKYDSFSHSLGGSAIMPVTSLANEMVDSSVRMHRDFIHMPDLIDATYRSHTACSFGRRSMNNETYFQVGLPSRGGINPGERTFHLEQVAEKLLVKEQKMNLF